MRVKFFTYNHYEAGGMEKSINDWLNDVVYLQKCNIVDIKQSMTEGGILITIWYDKTD